MGLLKIFLTLFISVTSWMLVIYCLMSWFVPPDIPVRMFIDRYMNQLLDPIRSFLPSFGMFDFSPIVLMLILQVLQRFVNML